MLLDSVLERWLFLLKAKGLHPAAPLCLIAVCTENVFAGRVLKSPWQDRGSALC